MKRWLTRSVIPRGFGIAGLNQITLGRLQILVGLIALVGLCWFGSRSSPPPTTAQPDVHSASQAPTVQQHHQTLISGTEQAIRTRELVSDETSKTEDFHDLRYIVKPGDTLEAIFRRKQFPITELYEILEADEPYLVMDVLRPDDELMFRVDQSNTLYALSLIVDPSKTVTYIRGEDGFVYDETLTSTVKVREVMRGEIAGSFFASASKAGLPGSVVMTISQLLKNTLNFRRDLRAGDQYQVVIEREIIDDQAIGKDRLLAIRIKSYRKEHGVYLHHDGAYYDAKGDSLFPALLRFPMQKQFRISSHFNPRRLHPVTGRYAPHNGVDFAMSVGTPVMSTGNGRVTRVAHHRFAGKYIVIDHFGPYKTRYLHMSKIFVTKGQHVERGQVIGLSGNTGRSTGPHLHYELHVNDKPVNPMKADIPMLQSIPNADIGDFRKLVRHMQELMHEENTVVKHVEKPAIESQRVERQINIGKSTATELLTSG